MATIDTIANRSTGSAIAGKAYFETSTNKFIVFNGSAWIELDSDGVGAVYQNRWGASFDGSNDFMTAPDDASLNVSSGFTVSAWIYLNSLNLFQGIASKRDNSGTNYQFYIRSTNILSYYNGASVYNDTTALSSGVWTHVAMTATSNSSASFYIDGSLSSTLPIGVITSSTSDLYIGQVTGVSHLKGKLDDLAIFDTELDANDIAAMYNGTAPNGKPTDLTLAASYDTDRTSNLKGYWRMGDDSSDTASANGSISTITDSSGNGNDATQGTASSQPTFKAFAQWVGTTLSFDGSNDYLTVTQNSDINITGDLTVSSWVRLSQISGYNAILTKRTVGGSMNYQFTIDGSGRIGLGHSGGSWVYDTNSLTVDTWHHVAATVSSGTVQFYIDGVAKTSDTGLTINGDTNDLTIGATLGYNHFAGTINEVAIFSTALSTSDITSLAASQTAHIVNDLSLSPVAYYRMGEDDSLADGASASQISDASGNGNHATQATAANQPTASIDPVIYV